MHVPNLSRIGMRICDFLQSVRNDEEEKKKKTKNFYWLISRERLEGSYSNLEWGLPCMEANSSANLMLFGLDIMELQMCENCDFVVPINILTLFVRTQFS